MLNSLTSKLLLGAGVAGGALAAFDVARFLRDPQVDKEGQPHGSVTGWLYGHRHMLGFAVGHAFDLNELGEGKKIRTEARTAQHQIFGWQGSIDGIGDAFRHAYAGALLTYRLMENFGKSATSAENFTRDVGRANEDDSMLTGKHHDNARTMDLHNNDVGISIGAKIADDPTISPAIAERELKRAVWDAINTGQAWVLEPSGGSPRPSRPQDIINHPRP